MMSGEISVVAYARISDDGENDGHGVRDQHKVNRETAKRLGWDIVHEFTDNDRSASKADVVREQFEEMLVVLRAGQLSNGTPVRGVVILAEDRLARRAGDYERFVEAVTHKEGRVYSDARGPKDLYSEDVEGLGLVGVAFSKIESRKVKRRITRWHRSRAESGKTPGGTRPFGWASENRLALDPVEAPLLARAIREFIGGRSLNSIVKEWQRAELRTSLGNEWSAKSLKLAVSNPRTCGLRVLNGAVVVSESGHPVIGDWEAIVSIEEWQAASAIIEARKGRQLSPQGDLGPLAGDFRDHKYLLTGIARCGKERIDGSICGAKLRVVHQRDCKQHIYACPSKVAGGCAGVGRRGDMVDAFVTEAVLAKLEERQAQERPEASVSDDRDALTVAEEKLQVLRRNWTASRVSDSLFFATARDLENQIAALRRQDARRSVQRLRAQREVADVRGRWFAGELDLSQQRAYVREALDAVVVLPAGKGRRRFDPDLLRLVWRT